MAKAKRDIYQEVTNRIIEALESGTIPWRKPWSQSIASQYGNLPMNAISNKPYRGINSLLLSIMPYDDPRWVTYKQARSLGGHVREGESGTMVVYFKMLRNEDKKTGDVSTFPLLRSYTVFNVEQCEGLEKLKVLKGEARDTGIDSMNDIVNAMPMRPAIRNKGIQACYIPHIDEVHMPAIESFKSPTSYYGTLFHELAHSTGHESRLNRPEVTNVQPFGSEDYSREELVAELASAMVCQTVGIDADIPQSAAYIKGWASRLKDDKKLIMKAASLAQKSADWILNVDAKSQEKAA